MYTLLTMKLIVILHVSACVRRRRNTPTVLMWFSISFMLLCLLVFFFFFNDTATTEIYTLSLHDALPISTKSACVPSFLLSETAFGWFRDRKSTRLNFSHLVISYAVFCLKKKKIATRRQARPVRIKGPREYHWPSAQG